MSCSHYIWTLLDHAQTRVPQSSSLHRELPQHPIRGRVLRLSLQGCNMIRAITPASL